MANGGAIIGDSLQYAANGGWQHGCTSQYHVLEELTHYEYQVP